jgi:hypothetical protein
MELPWESLRLLLLLRHLQGRAAAVVEAIPNRAAAFELQAR